MLGTFFTITSENVSSTIGYISDIIGDFSPILFVIMGVAVGIIVLEAIIGAVRGRH